MNKVQILDKLQRNLVMRGLSPVRGATTVTVEGMIISCVDASIQSPMGGVDGSSSPFLGMGVVAPGQIQVKGAAGENSLAAILTTEANLVVIREVCGFANDVVIVAGDSATVLATLTGNADLHMMGQ